MEWEISSEIFPQYGTSRRSKVRPFNIASMSWFLNCIPPKGWLWFCNWINNSLIPSCSCWVLYGITTLRSLNVYVWYCMSTYICSWYLLAILMYMLPPYQTLTAALHAGSFITRTYGQYRPSGEHSSPKGSSSFESWGTRNRMLWSCPLFSCFCVAHKCLR